MMKSEEREENGYEDGVDIFSAYKRKKTTFSESLEDDE
jgi:hypothetical protein